MKKTLALALAVVFVLAFAVPAFAQDMTHNATYKMDGTISLNKQVGHLCNTGAQLNQVITGEGEMEKVMNTAQVAHRLTVDDTNDFVTAADAVNNLSVQSGIALCAPAKHTLSATERTYLAEFWPPGTRFPHRDHIDANVAGDVEAWQTTGEWDWVPDALTGYGDGWEDITLRDQLMAWAPTAQERATIAAMPDALLEDFIATHYKARPWLAQFLVYNEWEYTPLTQQLWVARVEANPGEVGQLNQDFEAAYGPWDGTGVTPTHAGGSAEWGFVQRAGFAWGLSSGVNYVGNYFNIDQLAYTSGGETQRYIDLSSPFSGAMVHENMTVTGMAEIEDVFAMSNISPGEAATPDWWDMNW